MASCPSLCIPTNSSDLPNPSQGAGSGPVNDSHSPSLAIETLAGRDNTALVPGTMASVNTVSGAWTDISSPHREAGTVCLASGWFNLRTVGLHLGKIETIQNARAPSTRSLYENKWSVFEKWCSDMQEISFQCSVTVILGFLQDMMDKGKAFSTIKVYLAAIPACHIGFEGKAVGQPPLVCRFMRGTRRRLPVSKPLAPSWDLLSVLSHLLNHWNRWT